MKLIEQLGGYEAAKKFLDESNGSAWSGIFYMPKLKQSLLEHRRQHNISLSRSIINKTYITQ